ncbi:hypothetical protein [uncultured Croceitalea sp.]|uniref:hypothetical protein n=1 Tax=uncultured Croceitalea sp. TaxID=1798908 RepID=UPI003306803C
MKPLTTSANSFFWQDVEHLISPIVPDIKVLKSHCTNTPFGVGLMASLLKKHTPKASEHIAVQTIEPDGFCFRRLKNQPIPKFKLQNTDLC